MQAIRLKLKWSQSEFGRVLGLDQATVSRWENGKARLPVAFHVLARVLSGNLPKFSFEDVAKKKPGRPLKGDGFDRSKAKCPWPSCRHPERQMWSEGQIRQHCILGPLCPVYCNGTAGYPHQRVTRQLDRRGLLWEVQKLPRRKQLAPFEKRGVSRALAQMGPSANYEAILGVLARCTECAAPLIYQGHPSSTNKARRRLHVFRHPNKPCNLRLTQRFFDSKGNEKERIAPGGARKPSKYRIPRKTRNCPVCGDTFTLGAHPLVSEIGGRRYNPPLLKLVCPNSRKIDHRSPERRRSGVTFYYNRRRSRFEHTFTKALKQRGPAFSKCQVHGRMRRYTVYPHQLPRVPKRIQRILQIQEGDKVHRDYCACTYVWKRDDGKKQYRQRRFFVGAYRSKLTAAQLERRKKAYNQHYQRERRPQIREQRRRWRERNKKEVAAYQRVYRDKHRGRLRAQKHTYYLKRKRRLAGRPPR